LLAQQTAEDLSALGETDIAARSRFDQFLLTAHLRVAKHPDGSA